MFKKRDACGVILRSRGYLISYDLQISWLPYKLRQYSIIQNGWMQHARITTRVFSTLTRKFVGSGITLDVVNTNQGIEDTHFLSILIIAGALLKLLSRCGTSSAFVKHRIEVVAL